MTSKRITDSRNNTYDNYILPFFWQHNETDEELIAEIHAIYNSGIRALCVESRDYQGFGTDCWWHTMDVILAECKKLDIKVWLLDDESFPSGKANGSFKKRPDLAACGITERHSDVIGPVKGGAVMTMWETSDDDELVAVIACERDGYEEKLTGKVIDITNNVHDGLVYFDIPEGCYRIMFFYKTRSGMLPWTFNYADMFSDEATDIFIEAVYEEHYKRYKEYFGNTFVGFFSDEPCFANNTKADYKADFGIKYCHFPWRDEFLGMLNERLDGKAAECLPALWFDFGEQTARIRFEYMDMLTKRYSENFCWKLGNWCRAHGVEYIGHVIEDVGQHTKTSGGAGHYFRALDGQDMGGIDSVLGQTTPGATNNMIAVPCSYDVAPPDFFHFTLPKLAPSHAHIQPLKKGRAMCEIYGAYGWVEGLKTMKWMTDLMLVRGINYYVPHAFSPKFPDKDCPPHFYAKGTHPEFKDFKSLMDYINRASHILNGGLHIPTAAVLYHAEAEWASNDHTACDNVVRLLIENQLDLDIVPTDYLLNADIIDNKIVLNGESYPCLVVPGSKYLSLDAFKAIKRLSDNGVTVIFEDKMPTNAADAPDTDIAEYISSESCITLPHDEIAEYIRKNYYDIKAVDNAPYLRYYHYRHPENEVYFLTNEGIHKDIKTKIEFADDMGNEYIEYDAFKNTMVKKQLSDGCAEIEIPPYNSTMLIFGDLASDVSEYKAMTKTDDIALDEKYSVSISSATDYPEFKSYKSIDALVNMGGKDELPRFSGHFRYEKTVDIGNINKDSKYILDLGYVGECSTVYINGKACGTNTFPPYRHDITDALQNGENNILIEVATHYGNELRDFRSRYFLFEPTGLLGEVKIEVLK